MRSHSHDSIPETPHVHRCQRLGLTSLALLWRREQSELLEEMMLSGVSAVLIKVACIGEPLSLSPPLP